MNVAEDVSQPNEPEQQALPGREVVEQREWILTVDRSGLEYKVFVEAMTKKEARETFHEEYSFYEVGVEDEDFDWEHEALFARSKEHAEAGALQREREYMRTYQAPDLGNDAKILDVEPFDEVDGYKARRAKKEAEALD